MFPETITSWLYPEFVQSLVNGDFYQTNCPYCGSLFTYPQGEIMLNSPKGIVLIPNGPKEKLHKILYKLDVIDRNGNPYTSKELSEKLQYNLSHLDKNPVLKKQHEKIPIPDVTDVKLEDNDGEKRRKFFKFF